MSNKSSAKSLGTLADDPVLNALSATDIVVEESTPETVMAHPPVVVAEPAKETVETVSQEAHTEVSSEPTIPAETKEDTEKKVKAVSQATEPKAKAKEISQPSERPKVEVRTRGPRQVMLPKSMFINSDTIEEIWMPFFGAWSNVSIQTAPRLDEKKNPIPNTSSETSITLLKDKGAPYMDVFHENTSYRLGTIGPATKDADGLRFLDFPFGTLDGKWVRISFLPRWSPVSPRQCGFCQHITRVGEKTPQGFKSKGFKCVYHNKEGITRKDSCGSFLSGGKIRNNKGLAHGDLGRVTMEFVDKLLVQQFCDYVGIMKGQEPFNSRDRRVFANRSLMANIFNFAFVKDAGQHSAVCYLRKGEAYTDEIGKMRITKDGSAIWIPTQQNGKKVLSSFPHGIAGMSLIAIGLANLATDRIDSFPNLG